MNKRLLKWLRFFKEGKTLDADDPPRWIRKDKVMEEALDELKQFSDREADYHLYRQRRNYQLLANIDRRLMEEALRAKEKIEQKIKQIAQEKEQAEQVIKQVAREKEQAEHKIKQVEREKEQAVHKIKQVEREKEQAVQEKARLLAALAEKEALLGQAEAALKQKDDRRDLGHQS